MVRTKRYKLYHDGRFYDLEADPTERTRIRENRMDKSQKEVFDALTKIIAHYDSEGAAEDALLAKRQWAERVKAENKRKAAGAR
jgi:hypothetical protein